MGDTTCGDKHCDYCGTHCGGCGLPNDTRAVLLDLTVLCEQYLLDPRRTLDERQFRTAIKSAKAVLS